MTKDRLSETAALRALLSETPDAHVLAEMPGFVADRLMALDVDQLCGVGAHERSADRVNHRNGYRARAWETRAGTVEVNIPKLAPATSPRSLAVRSSLPCRWSGSGSCAPASTNAAPIGAAMPTATRASARHPSWDGERRRPQDRWNRRAFLSAVAGARPPIVRAVMLAIAEMYVNGVSTRDADKVMAEFGLKSLSSTQVSRAAKLLDEELDAWRSRPLGEIHYLFLDARYEKMRQGGVVRDAAVLSAIGVGADGRRRVLGVSFALSEAEIHWRAFLENLVERGMRGVHFVVSDDHAGLQAARRAVLGGAVWQRCQFHLAQNAIHHAPTPRSASASAPSCARSGTPPRWRRTKRLATGRDLPRHGPGTGRLARGQRPRRPGRLHPAGASPPAHADRQPDRARHPAGTQAPNRQGPRLSRQDSLSASSPPCSSKSTKNGASTASLHQLGHPGCLTTPQPKFQTSGCAIQRDPAGSNKDGSRISRLTLGVIGTSRKADERARVPITRITCPVCPKNIESG